MKARWLVLASIISIFIFYIIIFGNQHVSPVITYFPLDENNQFTTNKSTLKFQEDKNTLHWTSHSETNKAFYLRQDAALLFQNGLLKGVTSKWERNTHTIELDEHFKLNEQAKFNAIAVHFGEIHQKDQITSLYSMSDQTLYTLYDIDKLNYKGMMSPKLSEEKAAVTLLEQLTAKALKNNWSDLTQHFKIQSSDYTPIPLIDLIQYKDKPLPGLTQQKTNKVIGQLWEGLYKNYIIPATSIKKSNKNNFMPIILLDKKNTHLIVLFELNGEKEKLMQRIHQ